MSKSKVVDTIIAPEAPQPAAPALPTKMPYAIQLTEPIDVALQKAAILIKHHGFVPCSRTPTAVFGVTGMMTMTLVQGTVDQAFVPAAEAEIAQASEREAYAYQKDVEAAAARILQAKADAEAAAKRAELLAIQLKERAELEQRINALTTEIAAVSK